MSELSYLETPSGTQQQQNQLQNLQRFLQTEKQQNHLGGGWSKLSKSLKLKKMREYSQVYQTENSLSDADRQKLDEFLIDCVEKNRIQKVKDIVYDKETGQIKKIVALTQHSTGRFTLKSDAVVKNSTVKKRSTTSVAKKAATKTNIQKQQSEENIA